VVPEADARRDDLVSALVNLGYDARAIDKIIGPLLEDATLSFEQQLRGALKVLSRA
ncbi:MAG: Holliday junction branch migration protein RuvA, partial [Acidobacteria bacterium]|nr:Holliday junction branch migration protein RuvA [Acidobacteriota bacterium]